MDGRNHQPREVAVPLMLHTDMALIKDPAFKWHVQQFAEDENLWFSEFGKAWVRLQELGLEERRSRRPSGAGIQRWIQRLMGGCPQQMGAVSTVCSECREPLQMYHLPQKGEADHEFMVLAGDRERRQAAEEGKGSWPHIIRPVHVLDPSLPSVLGTRQDHPKPVQPMPRRVVL
eukprot:g32269.t1